MRATTRTLICLLLIPALVVGGATSTKAATNAEKASLGFLVVVVGVLFWLGWKADCEWNTVQDTSIDLARLDHLDVELVFDNEALGIQDAMPAAAGIRLAF